MAFQDNSAGPDKHTGFTYKKQEIILSKTRGHPFTGIATKKGWYSDTKRIEVATLFAVTGNATAVEGLTSVPAATIRGWVRQEWFKRLLDEIRTENDHLIDAKTTAIVVSALDKIQDRLENGDEVVLRDGSKVKKHISAKDLSIVTAINIDKRQLLRGKPTSRNEQLTNQSIEAKLEHLATSFRRIAQKKAPKELEVTDVEVLEEGPITIEATEETQMEGTKGG